MKTTLPFFLAAALLAAAARAVPVRVTADRVNIRAKPSFENSEVLGQLAYDQLVDQVAAEGDWIGIAPPPSVVCWVSADYVRDTDHVVTATRVNVRAGPSVNYSVLATLERGTVVEPRRTLDGWMEIAPPGDLRVWVYKDFIASADDSSTPDPPPVQTASLPAPRPFPAAPEPPRADPAPVPAPPPPKAPAAAPLPAPIPLPPAPTTNAAALAKPHPRRHRTPPYTRSEAEIAPTPVPVPALDILPAAPSASPAASPTPIVSPSSPATASDSPLPASFKLIPLDGQGKTAVHEGVLRPAPLFPGGPTRYRVLVWSDNRWQILCHVFGEAAKFRALQDKSVRVRGREYWVQDVSAPILVPEQIQEIVPQEN